jgi:hypothetical protein
MMEGDAGNGKQRYSEFLGRTGEVTICMAGFGRIWPDNMGKIEK